MINCYAINLFHRLKKTGITFIFGVGQRRRRMRQHFASVCGAYGSKLLAQTAHTVAICQRRRRMRQQIASVGGAYGSNLLAQTAHAVAKPCKIVCFASVDGAYGSNLLAYAAHAVAKTKWPVSHPSVKNVKILFQPSSPLPIQTS